MDDLWDDLRKLAEDDEDDQQKADEEDAKKSDSECDNPWLRHSDDESDSESDDRMRKGAERKLDRLEKNVGDLCDRLDFQIDAETETRWQDALHTFEELVKKKDEFVAKAQKIPKQFWLALGIVKEAILNTDKAEIKAKLEVTSFKKLATKYAENTDKYKAELDALQRVEEGEEPEEVKHEEGPEEDWTEEGLLKRLQNLPSKSKLRASLCTKIARHAEQQGLSGIYVTANIQMCLSFLDYPDTHMNSKTWKNVFDTVVKMFEQTTSPSHAVQVTESGSIESAVGPRKCLVPGGFSSFAFKLFEEIRQAQHFLEGSDANEITTFIYNENSLLGLLDTLYGFYINIGNKRASLKVATTMLEIVAPRTESAHREFMQRLQLTKYSILSESLQDLIRKLCAVVSRDPDYTVRSSLLLAYHYALHQQYAAARDLFQQVRATAHEVSLRAHEVLMNRIIAQLGIAAFCIGNFDDCALLLQDMCSRTPKDIRQLVGQDIQRQRFNETNLVKELQDRERLYPLQQHFSVDLLRAMSLFSHMLLEVVMESKKPFERTSRGKQFAKLLAQQPYMYLNGPSNHFESCIYAAYVAMQKGSVDLAEQSIRQIEVFRFQNSEGVMEQMIQRIRSDSLKVYITNFGANFSSLSLEYLCKKFRLSPVEARIAVSQVLLDRDTSIQGSWDDDEKHFTFVSGSRSKLHHLAEQCSERMFLLSATPVQMRAMDRKIPGRRRPPGK